MRGGLTLAELMIAMCIGLVLAGVCQTLLSRADRLFDRTRRQVELTTDLRALVETMERDVASMQQVLAASETELVLMRAADASVEGRLVKNASWAFPFVAGAATEQRMPGLRVTYTYDAPRHEVRRREESGEMSARTGEAVATLGTFAFEPAAAAAERVLCGAVKTCAFRLLGHDARGSLRSVFPPEAVRAPLALTQTAVIVLDVHARVESGVYAGTDRPVPDMHLMVPLWSAKRRSDAVYPECFSSTDEDLSW